MKIQKRVTQKESKDYIRNAQVQEKEALARLGKFEDLYDYVLASQQKIEEDMEKLRSQGKEKTTTFKQLLGQKLSNGNMLALFELYDL